MAKRFTDTEKWGDPWFRNLLREYQIFWIYLLDSCDSAGVWKVDFEMAEFCLKATINPKEIQKAFEDRIISFDGGARWFVPRFISFQYGTLDDNCRPHRSVLNLLKTYKIERYLKGIDTLKDKTKTITRQRHTDKTCKDCHRSFPNEATFKSHLAVCKETKVHA